MSRAFRWLQQTSRVKDAHINYIVRSGDEKAKWPGKSDDNRKELEDIIKKAGKWDDVSTLDTFALTKAADKWPESLANKIKRFQELVEERRLYLSGRKEE